jgi:hypothetical protein
VGDNLLSVGGPWQGLGSGEEVRLVLLYYVPVPASAYQPQFKSRQPNWAARLIPYRSCISMAFSCPRRI